MNVPRSVADVLSDHVVFEVECIDRMYCNVYIPGLQYAAGLVGYVHQQLGLPIASTAPLAKISERFSAAVHRFAVDHYYFYCGDEDFGPFFIKFCSYFPYNAKLWVNLNSS